MAMTDSGAHRAPRRLLDFGDYLLHGTATLGAAIAAAGTVPQQEEVGIGLVIAVSAILLAWRRSRTAAAPAVRDQTLEHEARIADLELQQARLFELEERLDFAERLLAKVDRPAELDGSARP